MPRPPLAWRRALVTTSAVAFVAVVGLIPATSAVAAERVPVSDATVSGPIPGTVPGDPSSGQLEDTYPFFSTPDDLASAGYVEEEFYLSGAADGYSIAGTPVATDVPYTTRMVVRRPADPKRFNGTALVEWQNVTAGYDLDALWDFERITREGFAWIGVSAQRVGVDQLRDWSPTRYGDLDVTGGREYVADQLSYDIFAQAGKAIDDPAGVDPMGGLDVGQVLAIGASQSAGRMRVYYDGILPKVEPVFDGYAFIVGSAPTRVGAEPVFQVLSETDVRSPDRPADTEQFRRWEVAGSAHAGWRGQQYRRPISVRDLGEAPEYDCELPPFSRMPLHHVTAAAYSHLATWSRGGPPPPTADPLRFNADGTKARNELGIALGGIQLSQAAVPTALNTGDNGGPSFCVLFGTHIPFDQEQLDALYPSHGRYVSQVVRVDHRNVRDGYLLRGDAKQNRLDAVRSGVGR